MAPEDTRKYRIHSLAKELGVSVQTIKNYEEKGILPRARRDDKGWRYYTGEDVLKVKALYMDDVAAGGRR
jgi:DNA-binding transcriptional MerR regulator